MTATKHLETPARSQEFVQASTINHLLMYMYRLEGQLEHAIKHHPGQAKMWTDRIDTIKQALEIVNEIEPY